MQVFQSVKRFFNRFCKIKKLDDKLVQTNCSAKRTWLRLKKKKKMFTHEDIDSSYFIICYRRLCCYPLLIRGTWKWLVLIPVVWPFVAAYQSTICQSLLQVAVWRRIQLRCLQDVRTAFDWILYDPRLTCFDLQLVACRERPGPGTSPDQEGEIRHVKTFFITRITRLSLFYCRVSDKNHAFKITHCRVK